MFSIKVVYEGTRRKGEVIAAQADCEPAQSEFTATGGTLVFNFNTAERFENAQKRIQRRYPTIHHGVRIHMLEAPTRRSLQVTAPIRLAALMAR